MSDPTLSIVFTDIAGLKKPISQSNRGITLARLRQHEALLLPIVIHHDGRVIKTLGTSFLLCFEDATSATRCGLVIQHTLEAHNAAAADTKPLRIRYGIHTGTVTAIGGDLFGDTVLTAHRVMRSCKPGQVLLSEMTYTALRTEEVPTVPTQPIPAKGKQPELRVYKINAAGEPQLYNGVLSDHEALARAYAHREIPKGIYSDSLLLTLERQRALGRIDIGRGSWIFAAAILLILTLPATYGITQLQQQSQVRHAANLVRAQDTTAALPLLIDLQKKRPADRRLPVLLEFAVVMDVQNSLKQKQFEEALSRIEVHRAKLPFLTVYSTLERTARISQTQFKETTSPDSPGETFEQLVQRYPADLDIRERYAQTLDIRGDELAAMNIYLDLIELKPEFTLKPKIRQHLERCLSKYEDERLQRTIATHLFNDLGDALKPNLYNPDSAPLRRNSYAIFSMAGADVDPVTFYTVELLTALPEETDNLDLILRFFEHQVISGATPSLVASTPIVTNNIPLLGVYEGNIANRSLAVINALFAERLRPLLQQFVSDQAKRGHRLNSYRVLLAHDWLTDELLLAYHVANIADHEPGQAHGFELLSTTWLVEEAPSDVKAQVIPLLESNQADLEQTIERWTEAGNDEPLASHEALLEQTKKALRRLGG
jgi:class 3 adenylate cyclase